MELKVFKIICVLSIIVNFIECYDWPRHKPTPNCTDLTPQRIVKIEEILGTWYGYEIFAHHMSTEDDVDLSPCVVVQMSDITYENEGNGDCGTLLGYMYSNHWVGKVMCEQ